LRHSRDDPGEPVTGDDRIYRCSRNPVALPAIRIVAYREPASWA